MAYQVVIYRKDPTAAAVEGRNLSRRILQSRVVEPYTQGGPITLRGVTVACLEIDHVRIFKTEYDLDESYSGLREILEDGQQFYSADATDMTDTFIVGPPGGTVEQPQSPFQDDKPKADPRAVFVVQGRNGEANSALDAYLRAIDLRPIEWPHATNATATGTPHNNQAVDAGFSRAHAVVVLFTPDDVVQLRKRFWAGNEPEYERRPNGQARPNVIYETGRAMERFPTRTVIVELGDLRPFSDIAGLNTIRMNDTPERRRDLADRLQAIGCGVKVDSRTIYSAGNFDAAIAEEPSEFPESSGDASYPATNTELSDSAEELLLEAVKDASASIWALSTMGGLIIATNNREFIEKGNARSEARWKKALSDLEEARLIEEATPKRESFKITDRGFALADSLDESIKES